MIKRQTGEGRERELPFSYLLMSSRSDTTRAQGRVARLSPGTQTGSQQGRPSRCVVVDPEQLTGQKARTPIRPGGAMTGRRDMESPGNFRAFDVSQSAL